jgi:hypothetical protein
MGLRLELLKSFKDFHSFVVPVFSFKFQISNFFQIYFSLHFSLNFHYFPIFSQKITKL